MKKYLSKLAAYRPSNRILLGTMGGFLLIWVLFFDSHSLLKRIAWQHELNTTRSQNEQLRVSIDERKLEVEQGISDEAVEQIARESYGMRKPGETVYQVKKEK